MASYRYHRQRAMAMDSSLLIYSTLPGAITVVVTGGTPPRVEKGTPCLPFKASVAEVVRATYGLSPSRSSPIRLNALICIYVLPDYIYICMYIDR